ncbi:MAG: hypothetical protein WCI67_08020, partial [Chloroflexales bacterium]
MGINTEHREPPKAIVIGTDRTRLEPILAALASAGYTATALSSDDNLEVSPLAQAAALAVFEREGSGNTAILASFRRLSQRPALAIIEPDGVVLSVGFGSLARGPHDLDDLAKLLRDHLGIEAAVAHPVSPSLAEKPDTPAPE